MKKILILILAIYISSLTVNANLQDNNFPKPPMRPKISEAERVQREKAFEQRLGLTEEQIKKSKELRLEGMDKIKPVIDKIKSREQEIQMVKNSKLAPQAQEEKLNSLNSDLKALHKEAHDIRVENMKSFEDILIPEQKKILKEMKQEGRQEYNRNHPPRNFNN